MPDDRSAPSPPFGWQWFLCQAGGGEGRRWGLLCPGWLVVWCRPAVTEAEARRKLAALRRLYGAAEPAGDFTCFCPLPQLDWGASLDTDNPDDWDAA